ncbi:hypothetical protein D9758_013193 [Tetrapyrgos nigripes]|uniref:Secreted protein n=1 Tax=Tetrapyrgos nigripes TaxID=182062 RepID=A0A8H5FR83_9AGAR|nr:hypothetical protein D9758_013193 [Tetrapyrgos nigripes]
MPTPSAFSSKSAFARTLAIATLTLIPLVVVDAVAFPKGGGGGKGGGSGGTTGGSTGGKGGSGGSGSGGSGSGGSGALEQLGQDILGILPSGGTQVGVHCGTTSDANLDDCKFLVDPNNWGGAFADNNVCHYTNPITQEINAAAYNVACHGQCQESFSAHSGSQADQFFPTIGCVYVARMPQDSLKDNSDLIREQAAGLFGCADTSKNKVNVMTQLSNKIGVCISNGNGCGDCFDDSDFS